MLASDIWTVLPVAALVSAVVSLLTPWIREGLTTKREEKLAILQIRNRIREGHYQRLLRLIEDLPVATRRYFRNSEGGIDVDMTALVNSIDDQCFYVEQKIIPVLPAGKRDELQSLVDQLRESILKVMNEFRNEERVINFPNANVSGRLTKTATSSLQNEIDTLSDALAIAPERSV